MGSPNGTIFGRRYTGIASINKEVHRRNRRNVRQYNNASKRHQNVRNNVIKTMDRSLRIATWNDNGLPKHSHEIKTFILSQNIDILLASKIGFTNRNYCHIPGYILYLIIRHRKNNEKLSILAKKMNKVLAVFSTLMLIFASSSSFSSPSKGLG